MMSSLRQLLSNSIGLKITYFGFAAYSLHTLAKFYLPSPNSFAPLNVLVMVFGVLGPLGLIVAVLSMIVTGVRGSRRNGIKSWWTLWTVVGVAPFVVLAISILSFNILVKDSKETLLNLNKDDIARVQQLANKVTEMKAKKASPLMISKVSRLYASDAYLYKGEIVEYLDEAGNSVKYQPTEKEIKRRNDMKEFPQKFEEAQHGRFAAIIILFAIPLLVVIVALFIPIKRKI
jgi:hypothetical protein